MTLEELSEAIPPHYSEYIGHAAMEAIVSTKPIDIIMGREKGIMAERDEEKERYKKALKNILNTAPWAGDEGHHQCIDEARKALGLPSLNPFVE